MLLEAQNLYRVFSERGNRGMVGARILASVLVIVLVAGLVFTGAIDELFQTTPPAVVLSQEPRTLLVIQGQYRTFDLTVYSIRQHLILTHSPCDVVLALDCAESDVSQHVLDVLQPFLVASFFDLGRQRLKGAIEFAQVNYALERVNVSTYEFILKTRTDVFIRHPMDFRVAYGLSNFRTAWEDFERGRTRNLTLDRAFSAWFLTGGGAVLFWSQMVDQEHAMAWAPISSRTAAKSLLRDSARVSAESAERTAASVQPRIQDLAKRHHLCYVVGSTWVHFCRTQDYFRLQRALVSLWGQLSWLEHGYNVSFRKHEKTVTESHLRLAALKLNISFVDLRNIIDYGASFWKKCSAGFTFFSKLSRLFAFILRPAQARLGPFLESGDCATTFLNMSKKLQ